jgi:hypothetical protein
MFSTGVDSLCLIQRCLFHRCLVIALDLGCSDSSLLGHKVDDFRLLDSSFVLLKVQSTLQILLFRRTLLFHLSLCMAFLINDHLIVVLIQGDSDLLGLICSLLLTFLRLYLCSLSLIL